MNIEQPLDFELQYMRSVIEKLIALEPRFAIEFCFLYKISGVKAERKVKFIPLKRTTTLEK